MEEEFHTERGNVYHQNVHTLIFHTTNVMEMIMKRRNVMINAVQVNTNTTTLCINLHNPYDIQNQTILVNGQHGASAALVVERAKSSARGNATNLNVQQITEGVKEVTMSMLTVTLVAVQVRKRISYRYSDVTFFYQQRMATGAHGLVGVTAQYLVAMDNKGEKENVMNQNVEERAVGAANTVPSPATFNVKLPQLKETTMINISGSDIDRFLWTVTFSNPIFLYILSRVYIYLV